MALEKYWEGVVLEMETPYTYPFTKYFFTLFSSPVLCYVTKIQVLF